MRALNDELLPGAHETESRSPVLSEQEFARRCSLLGELGQWLDAAGARCVLARHQRLVLGGRPGRGPSGKTDPVLHIFGPDGAEGKARTSGAVFRLDDGEEFPVSDPALAAAQIGKSLGCQGAG